MVKLWLVFLSSLLVPFFVEQLWRVSSDRRSYEGWCKGTMVMVLISDLVVRWSHKSAIGNRLSS
jgi:hypothetical protein